MALCNPKNCKPPRFKLNWYNFKESFEKLWKWKINFYGSLIVFSHLPIFIKRCIIAKSTCVIYAEAFTLHFFIIFYHFLPTFRIYCSELHVGIVLGLVCAFFVYLGPLSDSSNITDEIVDGGFIIIRSKMIKLFLSRTSARIVKVKTVLLL